MHPYTRNSRFGTVMHNRFSHVSTRHNDDAIDMTEHIATVSKPDVSAVDDNTGQLTHRERQVLALMSAGMTNAQIAAVKSQGYAGWLGRQMGATSQTGWDWLDSKGYNDPFNEKVEAFRDLRAQLIPLMASQGEARSASYRRRRLRGPQTSAEVPSLRKGRRS